MGRRILLVTHFYPPGHIGGTEVLAEGLARTLTARGHTVQVLCAEDWATAPMPQIEATDDVYRGVPVRRLHFNWTRAPDVFRYLYANPEVEQYLSGYLRAQRPEIVHILSCYSLSASVIAAARAAGVPMVLTATDYWFLCARNTLLRHDGSLCSGPDHPWKCARCMLDGSKAYRWPRAVLPEAAVAALLLQVGRIPQLTSRPGLRGMLGTWRERLAYLADSLAKVDQIVTASRLVRERFVAYGVDRQKIVVSSYGLDTAWARAFTAKPPSAELRVGFIGQILPFKGPDLLLRAVRSLQDMPIRALIYGDLDKSPAYGRQLRSLAGDDGRIAFCGTFEHSRIGEVLSGIDVLVIPSIWYDFPLVIPAALATRTPVLATDLPGMNELITHETNGLLFPRSDWQALAVQLRRLLEEPDLWARLRDGIGPVKTLEAAAVEYEAIYDRLVPR